MAAGLLGAGTSASGARLDVPDQYATIQTAIDSAVAGDTVVLAAGTYTGTGNVELDFGGKNLVLLAPSGPDSTEIDCQSSGFRAIHLHSGEDSTTLIEGITFRNGDALEGMVHLEGASPTFRNCVFRDYYLYDQATAFLCDSASPTLIDCAFVDNVVGCSACKRPEDITRLPLYVAGALKCVNNAAPVLKRCSFANNMSDAEGAGGAISLQNSSITIDSSTFFNNVATEAGIGGPDPFGGAIAAFRSTVTLYVCQFDSNMASGAGGAVYADDSSTVNIVASTFTRNRVDNYYRGGALYTDSTVLTIDSSAFVENQATSGGAVYIARSQVTLSSTALTDNVAREMTFDEVARGGALYADSSDLTLTGVTISHNLADSSGFGEPGLGGGLYLRRTSPAITRTIIAFSQEGEAIHSSDSTSIANLSCSNLFGNAGGDWTGPLASQHDTNANFSTDPFFCDTAAGDFSLHDISPCTDSLSPCSLQVGAYGAGCENSAPKIISPDSADAFEGTPFRYQLAYSDNLMPETLITFDNLPSWLTADADSVYGTASADDADTSFRARVSDGYLVDSLIINVHTIKTNDPPSLGQISPRQVAEGDSLSFELSASDPDSSVPVLTVDSLPYGAAFVDNQDGTGRFSWQPAYFQAGQYDIAFYATDDSSAVDTMTVAIDVLNRNAPPELGLIPDTAVLEDDSLVLVVSATDPDSLIPSLSADSLPPGADFTDDSTGVGTFRWLPGFEDAGNYEIYFVATDDSLVTDTAVVTVTVLNVNRPPSLDSVPDQIVDEGDTLVFYLSAADPDSTIPMLAIDSLPFGAVFTDSGNGTGSCSWTPGYHQRGEYLLLARAEDDSVAVTQPFTVTVNDVDVPPVLDSIGPRETMQGDTLVLTVSASDPDSTVPSLRVEPLPDSSSFLDRADGTGVFTWPVQCEQNGAYALYVIAEDTLQADTELVTITVLPRPPEIDSLSVDGSPEPTHVVDHNPLITWTYSDFCGRSQTAVEIAFGVDNDWAFAELWNPAPVDTAGTSLSYEGAPLEDGQTYFLRLRVNNGLVWSEWAELSFHMNSLPTAPERLKPVEGAVVMTGTPVLFVANASDPESDSLSYLFQLFSDSSLQDLAVESELTVEAIDSTAWTVALALMDNNRYWWRCRAFDGFEFGPFSDSASFVVNSEATPPGPAHCLFPPDTSATNQIVYDMLPSFHWTPAIDPDPLDTVSYWLVLATDSSFESVVSVDTASDTTFLSTDSLSFGQQYWWRVESVDRAGLVSTSENVLSFTTWRLGDVTLDGETDLADLLYLVNRLFLGGPDIEPLFTGDVNGNCAVDLADVIYLANSLFLGGAPPVPGCDPELVTG
ncbi:hypothetical protein GF420_06900 [candidate division GN15 bacterium]|nr:hypothetical protein [candidate division GN15 bacterium]